MMTITTRPLAPEDGTAAASVFFDAVHNGAADVYTIEQRKAWAGNAPNPTLWRHKFENIAGFAADIDGAMVGFMTLDAYGYIDLAFVRADVSGHGIGQSLYTLIEAQAVSTGIKRLTTAASKKAKPFFMRVGWEVDHEQVVIISGVSLTNFKMSKSLAMNV